MLVVFLIILILAVAYISVILPRVINKADMSELKTDYAHRGLYGKDLPENSVGAFRKAVEKGYGIELDIQLSKDGIPMVFHDETLNRVCGIDGKLRDYTYKELSQMHLSNSEEYTIPTFAEVLSIIDGKVPLLVEFKTGTLDLCDVAIKMLDEYEGPFCVESFDPFILKKIRKMRPQYARGQLVCNFVKEKVFKNPFLNIALTILVSNMFSRPDFVAYDIKMKGNFSVFLCRKLFRIKMFSWTIRNQDDYDYCKKKSLTPIFEGFIPN